MDDLLTLHADRVAASNTAHKAAVADVRDSADEALRKLIADFGARLTEACGVVSDACQAMLAGIESIATTALTESGAAFAANLAEIAASGAAMEAEMRQRAAFLMTGKLPVTDPLPGVAEPLSGEASEPERTAA